VENQKHKIFWSLWEKAVKISFLGKKHNVFTCNDQQKMVKSKEHSSPTLPVAKSHFLNILLKKKRKNLKTVAGLSTFCCKKAVKKP
jgi:hypothetical protein